MKLIGVKTKEKAEIDENLFGLLAPYKKYNTYMRMLVNEEKKKAVLQMTDNPSNWRNLDPKLLEGFKCLKRVDLNMNKLFLKYLSPEHIISHLGPTLGIKIPLKTTNVENYLEDRGKGYFSITVPIKYVQALHATMKKIINLSPLKKYEILEKYVTYKS